MLMGNSTINSEDSKRQLSIEEIREKLGKAVCSGEHTDIKNLAKEIRLPITDPYNNKESAFSVLYDRIANELARRESVRQIDSTNNIANTAKWAAIFSSVGALISAICTIIILVKSC